MFEKEAQMSTFTSYRDIESELTRDVFVQSTLSWDKNTCFKRPIFN